MKRIKCGAEFSRMPDAEKRSYLSQLVETAGGIKEAALKYSGSARNGRNGNDGIVDDYRQLQCLAMLGIIDSDSETRRIAAELYRKVVPYNAVKEDRPKKLF